MRTFAVYIEDRRYGAMTLQLIFADDEGEARAWAESQLIACEHHLAVEVHEDGACLYRRARLPSGAGP